MTDADKEPYTHSHSLKPSSSKVLKASSRNEEEIVGLEQEALIPYIDADAGRQNSVTLERKGIARLAINGSKGGAERSGTAKKNSEEKVLGTKIGSKNLNEHEKLNDDSTESEFEQVSGLCSQNMNDVDKMRASYMERLHSTSTTTHQSQDYTSLDSDQQFLSSTNSAFSPVVPMISTLSSCSVESSASPQLQKNTPVDSTNLISATAKRSFVELTESRSLAAGQYTETEIQKTIRIRRSPLIEEEENEEDQRETSEDDLKDVCLNVSADDKDAEKLLTKSIQVISSPKDSMVKSEYLTHLSHMLMDDCRQFHTDENVCDLHTDECHGSQTVHTNSHGAHQSTISKLLIDYLICCKKTDGKVKLLRRK